MLRTNQLTYQFADQPQLSFPDIHISKGQHHLVIGPSGCGKTTLLHLLAGLRRPLSGSIIINDQDMSSLSSGALDQYRGEHIGIIFQTPHFVNSLNVIDNITLAQELSGRKVDSSRARDLLERLGIGSKEKILTESLSIGEQQRVAIARALINQPPIIFADEPTSALDDQNAQAVVSLLKEQADSSGATLIVVTHDNRLQDQFTYKIAL